MIPEAVIGKLSILNVNAGDMEFHFDPNDPQETARASRVVQDMLARGYLLFAHVGKKLCPVKSFDPKRCVYKIADGPGPVATPEPQAKRGRRRKATTEVSAASTKVRAVAPTAGG